MTAVVVRKRGDAFAFYCTYFNTLLYILQVNLCNTNVHRWVCCLEDDRKGSAPPLPVSVLDKVCRVDRQRVDMSDMLTRLVSGPEVDGVTAWRQHARVEAIHRWRHVILMNRTRRHSHILTCIPIHT